MHANQPEPSLAAAPTEIRPGVAALISDDRGHFLMHRRPIGDGWAPPSGHVEPGERLLDALLREIHEETTLTVEVRRLLGVYSDPAFQVVRYPDGRRVHFVTCVFHCHVIGGELRGSAEGTAWGWFAPPDLPNTLLPYARVWMDGIAAPDVVVR
jgi:ADP-ribose pyrophosphatase YjhB (NUDIX family)